jgi:hypothetical protein
VGGALWYNEGRMGLHQEQESQYGEPDLGRRAERTSQANLQCGGGGPVIQQQSYANYFVVTCDKCGRLDSVSTVKTATQAKRIANTSFSWEMDTPLGDLCRRCAGEWRDGSPDKGRAGPSIM